MIGFVTDSGSNMKAAINQFSSRVLKFPCSAHKLNLAVNDLFKSKILKIKFNKSTNTSYLVVRSFDSKGNSKDIIIDEIEKSRIEEQNLIKENYLNPLIGRCKKLVGSFSHSEGLNRRLKVKQDELGLERKVKLVQEVSTRWNSTLDMLDSILTNEDPLKCMSVESVNNCIANNVPNEIEFDFIYGFYKLLKPLKELTVYFSGSSYVTTSILHPSLYQLVNNVLPSFDFSDSKLNILRDNLIDNIKNRFAYILNDSINEFFIMSSYMDYNYRKFSYLNDELKIEFAKKRAKSTIINYYALYLEHNRTQNEEMYLERPSSNVSTPENSSISSKEIPSRQNTRKSRDLNDTNFLSTLNDKTTSVQKEISSLEKEFLIYESFDFVAKPGNPSFMNTLEFYKLYKTKIPSLAELSQLVFSVTASSVPSENLFSSAGWVQNELRNRIQPSALEMVNFIIKNKYK